MSTQRLSMAPAQIALRVILAFSLGLAPVIAPAQAPGTSQQIKFHVNGPAQRLEMIVSTSRILEMDFRVPKMLVNNPEIVQASPLSPNQVQISALKPGVTQLNMWDEKDQIHSVDVVVFGDARELVDLLTAEFPDASLSVRPLNSSVVLSGYVPSAGMVSRIVGMAEDYYPKVINNITVGGAQTVLLHCKILEVSRTKLRAIGFDWALFAGNDAIVQNVAGLLANYTLSPPSVASNMGETIAFGIINGGNEFFGFLEALRQNNLVKVLAEPTLVTVSGRPASFNSGGEFPIIVPQSLGTVSIEYRQFGTRVDFVPIVLGNGSIRLEVRPQVSEVDPARSVNINNVNIPGLRNRWVDTAVEMQAGQTLALAGLIQNRVEAEKRGIPWLGDLPWVGAAFRRIEETTNEVELLIMVTPEFVDAMDPHEVPRCGPGQFTTSPNEVELHFRGYLEVPRCCTDGSCPKCQLGQGPGAAYEEVQPADLQTDSAAVGNQPAAVGPRQSAVRRQIGDTPHSPRQPYGSGVRVPYNPNKRQQTPAESPRNQGEDEPTLIGPVGYDVLP